MSYLPIQFSIRRSDDSGVTVATESGHEFRVSHAALPTDADQNFALGDLQADGIEDDELPQLAHAILNEIIGADSPNLAIRHATQGEEINSR